MNGLEKELAACERVCAHVDLDHILFNMSRMKERIAPETKMIAVIKTDGYGHGSIPIAKCLEPLEYLYGFAVAAPEEAFLLRENGIEKPILILGYTFPYAYERMAALGIRPAAFRPDSFSEMAAAAVRAGRPMKLHIKVDTGMGRIGITPDEAGLEAIREAARYVRRGDLEIEGIFTHFARADECDKTSARGQLECFTSFVRQAERELAQPIPVKHCANSAAILELPEASLDVVRAGIALYGLAPSDEVNGANAGLKPALSLRSRIVHVKTIHGGQSVSYGGTFTAERDMRVATIPVGYGDGYPRSLSGGKGYVLIRGRKAPILGRVCMDQFMTDVTDIPGAQPGDTVTLIGEDAGETITAQQLGGLSGRFNYELVCDLNKRVPRVYHRDGKITAVLDMNGYHEQPVGQNM